MPGIQMIFGLLAASRLGSTSAGILLMKGYPIGFVTLLECYSTTPDGYRDSLQ